MKKRLSVSVFRINTSGITLKKIDLQGLNFPMEKALRAKLAKTGWQLARNTSQKLSTANLF